MLKYIETKVVLEEVPDEITLAINISGCPNRCPGCHSPHLWEDSGTSLTEDNLMNLISKNPGITCVCLLGGDADPEYTAALFKSVKKNTDLKTCWYSGRDMDYGYEGLKYLDFIKTGPYIKEKGPLTSPVTNQRFHSVCYDSTEDTISLKDITFKFQRT